MVIEISIKTPGAHLKEGAMVETVRLRIGQNTRAYEHDVATEESSRAIGEEEIMSAAERRVWRLRTATEVRTSSANRAWAVMAIGAVVVGLGAFALVRARR